MSVDSEANIGKTCDGGEKYWMARAGVGAGQADNFL